jgi:hypothetical protein
MANSEWHWTEGNKYALEANKALLLINGGAAVALLAFAGNFAKEGSEGARIASSLSSSLLAFGTGALLSAIVLSLPIIPNANTAEAARATSCSHMALRHLRDTGLHNRSFCDRALVGA